MWRGMGISPVGIRIPETVSGCLLVIRLPSLIQGRPGGRRVNLCHRSRPCPSRHPVPPPLLRDLPLYQVSTGARHRVGPSCPTVERCVKRSCGESPALQRVTFTGRVLTFDNRGLCEPAEAGILHQKRDPLEWGGPQSVT